jgi:hypothetical protein
MPVPMHIVQYSPKNYTENKTQERGCTRKAHAAGVMESGAPITRPRYLVTMLALLIIGTGHPDLFRSTCKQAYD